MSRVSQAQMKELLDILSEDGVLVKGKLSYSNMNRQIFWKRVALQLNSIEGGGYKNTWKWCKMWADWKNKTKKKANILLKKQHYSYGPQVTPLNKLELRLLKMINYPMDDKKLDIDMISNSRAELPEVSTDELPEFLTELTEDQDDQLDQNHRSSDEEDNTAYQSQSQSQFCNVDELSHDGESKSEDCEESFDVEKNDKMKGEKFKKKKTSLEEFKLRTTMALEKEKVQQKSEELRLRALELKLKGEELKLKEIEMNKINYLTKIEEDKLKCFKDISSSLKELLDRTKNGTSRFQNIL